MWLDTHDPVGLDGWKAGQQIDLRTEVVVPEMRPPGSYHDDGIVSDEIGPLPGKPGESPGIIVKEDAVLAPRLTALD